MGTPQGTGGWQGPPSTHRKAGGPCGPGVARLSWRSLCVRMMTLSHPQCPRQVPTPTGHQCPPVPSPHSTHRLPLGSSQPGRATFPLETLGGEKRGDAGGSPTAPPGAVPTWQQDLSTAHGVCDMCQPAGTLLGPCWDPAWAPCTPAGTGVSAQAWWGHSNPGAVTLGSRKLSPGGAPALSSSLVPPVLLPG